MLMKIGVCLTTVIAACREFAYTRGDVSLDSGNISLTVGLHRQALFFWECLYSSVRELRI